MQTVAIVGVGLIGGSFGLALRKTGFAGPILGVSSPAAITAALDAGAISRFATLQEAAHLADLIYLSQPVDRIIQTLEWLGPVARAETLITDAGSTKSAIVKAASLHLQHASFIGGHPMAGKESRGAQSADADLFRNRLYVLTPEAAPVPPDFRRLLDGIGAHVLEMTADDHDSTVALTSHLPQLISTSLAALLGRQQQPHLDRVFGSGLLDMTRLALSPAELWESILTTNKPNVMRGIDAYIAILNEFKQALASGDVDSFFEIGGRFASSIRKQSEQ